MKVRDAQLSAAGAEGKTYIEDVFSTYLYTGNGSTQTINNGIDLAGKGGMVWLKTRARTSGDVYCNNFIWDTVRGNGLTSYLYTNTAEAQGATGSYGVGPVFNNNGFNTPSASSQNTETYVSWTFRKAPKFFDVVTWTGDDSDKTIAHSLGTDPGMIIVKRTDTTSNWRVYHRSLSLPNESWAHLNVANAAFTSGGTSIWNATSTSFQASTYLGLSTSGGTYVAYLFAHDTTTDGLIQCGTYTGNGSSDGPTINLGWEPQYVLLKRADSTGDWFIMDNMRGLNYSPNGDNYLYANTTAAEVSSTVDIMGPTATGFKINQSGTLVNASGGTYLYMAIRRGPMKIPTDGTKVFQPISRTGTGGAVTVSTNFTPDLAIVQPRNAGANDALWVDRLRDNYILLSGGIGAESSTTSYFPMIMWDNQTGFDLGGSAGTNSASYQYANWVFKRAPGFFDAVCYSGNTGVGQTQYSHNLGVAPELIIVKSRNNSTNWIVAAGADSWKRLYLNTTGASALIPILDNVTSTTFNYSFGSAENNATGYTYVAYLFASCPGISKVGSYIGTGSAMNINCGFINGAKFVLIKRTDSTGDWYVFDTARGINAGTDPMLLLNNTNNEVTTSDIIDPYPQGFSLPAGVDSTNANGGTYIYLAIA